MYGLTSRQFEELTAELLKRQGYEVELMVETRDGGKDLTVDVAPSVIQLHPGAAEAYRRLAENLHQAIEGDDGEEVRKELRQLIDRVDFIPAEGLGKFQLEVHGSLAALLALGQAQKAENPTGGACGVSLGAGAGFEPATFRL